MRENNIHIKLLSKMDNPINVSSKQGLSKSHLYRDQNLNLCFLTASVSVLDIISALWSISLQPGFKMLMCNKMTHLPITCTQVLYFVCIVANRELVQQPSSAKVRALKLWSKACCQWDSLSGCFSFVILSFKVDQSWYSKGDGTRSGPTVWHLNIFVKITIANPDQIC